MGHEPPTHRDFSPCLQQTSILFMAYLCSLKVPLNPNQPTIDRGTLLMLTLHPHKLCLFSVTV